MCVVRTKSAKYSIVVRPVLQCPFPCIPLCNILYLRYFPSLIYSIKWHSSINRFSSIVPMFSMITNLHLFSLMCKHTTEWFILWKTSVQDLLWNASSFRQSSPFSQNTGTSWTNTGGTNLVSLNKHSPLRSFFCWSAYSVDTSVHIWGGKYPVRIVVPYV